MGLECINGLTGIGELCTNTNQFGPMTGFFLQVPTDTFSASDVVTEDTVKGKIRDKLWYPVHNIQTLENQTVEDGEFTGNTGTKSLQYRGKKGYRIGVQMDLDSHKAAFGYSGKNFRIIKADVNNTLRFTKSGTDEYRGFKLAYLKVSDQMEPTGADNPAMTYFDIQEADVNEWSLNGAFTSNLSYLVSELTGLATVVVTQVGTVATNSGVFDVAYTASSNLDGSNSGTAVSNAITGLLAANFQLRAAADSSITTPADSVTESTTVPGRYTVAFTTFVTTDEIKVIPSTAQLYESAYLTVS